MFGTYQDILSIIELNTTMKLIRFLLENELEIENLVAVVAQFFLFSFSSTSQKAKK